MKQLLLFLFLPLTVSAQISNTGRSMGGPFANRPACSRNVHDGNAHNGDVYTDTDDGNVYKCSGGAWWAAGRKTISPVGSSYFVPGLSTSVTPVVGHCANWATTTTLGDGGVCGGGTDIADITSFGGALVDINATPYLPGITANCTSSSTTLPISSASSFVNWIGVAVQNCGASLTLSTPAAPKVASDLLAAPQGSWYDVGGAAGGSETTCYVIVAIQKGQGHTAGSTETCVTGQTRGFVETNLTSCVRSANTLVTCTTSANTLAAGAWVKVHATNME